MPGGAGGVVKQVTFHSFAKSEVALVCRRMSLTCLHYKASVLTVLRRLVLYKRVSLS